MEKLCQAHVSVCLALSPLPARVCVLENLLAIWNYAMQKKKEAMQMQSPHMATGCAAGGGGGTGKEERRQRSGATQGGTQRILQHQSNTWPTLNNIEHWTLAIPFDAIRFATLNDAKLNIQTTRQSAENWWKILNNKKMETTLNPVEIFGILIYVF